MIVTTALVLLASILLWLNFSSNKTNKASEPIDSLETTSRDHQVPQTSHETPISIHPQSHPTQFLRAKSMRDIEHNPSRRLIAVRNVVFDVTADESFALNGVKQRLVGHECHLALLENRFDDDRSVCV